MIKSIFVAAFLLLISQTVLAQKAKPMPTPAPFVQAQTLDDKIQSELKNFSGKAWIYAKNLDTGKDYALRADEQARTASTIKLPIMTEVFRQVAAGKIRWTDEFVLAKKQGGSGVLGEFSENSKIDLKTAVNLMIVVSDNTATNLILDKITADSVNDFMDTLGLAQTRSLRKIGGGGDAKANADERLKLFGIGVSSPRDMVKLMEMLERGEVVNRESSAEMISILKRQQFKDGIGRGLPDTVPSASKSGALDRLRSDVGIIYTRRGRIAMAITVDDMMEVTYTPENPGLKMLWRLSQILQDGLGK
ncbi:MAG TPA: serine hydrolase [Pyrinomonadaceae bacterium]|nr:serine hydrolase [Pyrinomonadaceae bacterium]